MGTRTLALQASVIETFRKRGASPWNYIADVVRKRRRGSAAPPRPLSDHTQPRAPIAEG
ncbi:MAG: hypothetical protein WBG92_08965 [Thiohalocapsa sp.]